MPFVPRNFLHVRHSILIPNGLVSRYRQCSVCGSLAEEQVKPEMYEFYLFWINFKSENYSLVLVGWQHHQLTRQAVHRCRHYPSDPWWRNHYWQRPVRHRLLFCRSRWEGLANRKPHFHFLRLRDWPPANWLWDCNNRRRHSVPPRKSLKDFNLQLRHSVLSAVVEAAADLTADLRYSQLVAVHSAIQSISPPRRTAPAARLRRWERARATRRLLRHFRRPRQKFPHRLPARVIRLRRSRSRSSKDQHRWWSSSAKVTKSIE